MSAVARVTQDLLLILCPIQHSRPNPVEIDAIVDLSAKDGIDGALAQIVGEFSPLMYKSTGTAGKIFAIVHGHGQSAASLQVRLQNMGTVDGVDLSSATVTERDLDGFVAT